MFAAQDFILTKSYKMAILKEKGSKKCLVCNAKVEAVMYILIKREKLEQERYKKRHDLIL